VAGALALLFACDRPEPFVRRALAPSFNPFGPPDPLFAPQPPRDHPVAVALSGDGSRLYVALQGVEDAPGDSVAVLSTLSGFLLRRIPVCSSPTSLRLHPGGRFLAVTCRFANHAAIIDLTTDEVSVHVPVPYYTEDVVFTPDGRRAFLANRWKDSVLRWDLAVGESFRVTSDDYSRTAPDLPVGIQVGQNPRELVLSPSGDRLYVASLAGTTVSVIDTARGLELRRVSLNSPPGGLAANDRFVFVTHTGRGTQHPPDEGEDTDGDGKPGDGTANVMFQDLQNEISVLSREGDLLETYTSDTLCCFDFRDVDPRNPARGALLSAPDTWPASRVNFLPPRDRWIVAGALPEKLSLSGDLLLAVFSGSNEVQPFRVGEDGLLTPLLRAGELYRTGMNPAGIAVSPNGRRAYVAERLGERVTVLDLAAGPGNERRFLAGDVSGGEFPATDAEIGEAINFVTAPFTVDGDQTCVHCHREGGNLAKPVAMPLQADPVWGTRMPMAARGAADTRPWFHESAMDEANFFPVINEFSRKENFCCEHTDSLVWNRYPAASVCSTKPATQGCNHVLRCKAEPPPECATRPYGVSALTRNEYFLAAARKLFGRDRTFGDALRKVAGDGSYEGLPLDFGGVTRALGLFLMQRPRFLPNPNAALDLPAARRGRALYESPGVGCASCHPLPLTTVTRDFNPFRIPLRMPPVVSPRRRPAGADADRVTAGFLQTFPTVEQSKGGLFLGVNQLRGIWDRAERFLHDGRARSLREALASPGHPVLRHWETGFNETGGVSDTHGATSNLTPDQMEDLIAFLHTL
jgi:DNA-binding beta-propeller fold protein YncE